jgi:RND family efflux transporter MFP subunit
MKRWCCLLLAFFAAGCSRSADEEANNPEPVALVKLAPAQTGNTGQQFMLYGAAELGPAGRVAMTAPLEATVSAILAPAGTMVSRGQEIVRLTSSPVAHADAAKAAADSDAAAKALARAVRLRDDGLGSNADVETARAAWTGAEALQASFVHRSGALVIKAPAEGTIDNVAVAVGDQLQPGAAVASLTRAGDLRARFGIDPDTARMIRPGMPVRIKRGAGNSLDAYVQSISRVVDPQTRLASLFVLLPAGSDIAPGETLSATVDVRHGAAGITIPYAALSNDAGQPFVFVVEKGVALRRDVTTQASLGGEVTILKGLRAGEQVVVEGATAVEDGMKVRTR